MRLGLFGGTFDPPHNGHLFMASRAREEAGLDRIVFIPCWRSPHKRNVVSATPEDRLRMLEIATQDLPWAVASNWEIDRTGEPSYSWMTAEHFADSHPDAALHWILGGDQWRVLETWREPKRLAKLVTFIVVAREETPRPRPGYRAIFINDICDVSATRVRKAIAGGDTVDDLVPTPVAGYIEREGLYR